MVRKTIELIDELFESGQLHDMVKLGFVHPSAIVNRNIYHAYNSRVITTGSKMQAMEDVAENFGVSFETVRLARRTMDFEFVKNN
jgi:hypothetical protein